MPLFAKVGQTVALLYLLTGTLRGQPTADLTQVLQRLDRLEKDNRTLAEEIQSLRTQLQAAGLSAQPDAPPLAERMEVAERRVEEQAQTKVESSQKLPLTLEGMVLMNTFWNTHDTAGAQNPTLLPSSTEGLPRTYGATLRQSLVGLRYRGPTLAGARLTGSMSLDLYGGTTQALNHLVRLRTATVELNWGKRFLLVGQDKPLISERNPASLAQVGVVPLTNAGNIWLWQPQVRFGQEFALTSNSTLKAHVAMHQTREESTEVPELFAASFARISSSMPNSALRVAWRCTSHPVRKKTAASMAVAANSALVSNDVRATGSSISAPQHRSVPRRGRSRGRTCFYGAPAGSRSRR